MSKLLKVSVVFLFSILFTSPGWAVLISDLSAGALNGTDVGSIDILEGQTNDLGTCGPGSDPGAEECWAESVLGMDLTLDGKTEDVTAYDTNTTNVVAFQLAFGGGYYVLKNSTWWAIVQNVADLNWGVVDTSLLNPGFNLTDDPLILSHVTEFDGTTTTVPEPGAVALLGAGLLAIGFLRRRRRT